MPKWLSTEANCFTAGGFPSNPIPVRVCAEQLRVYYYGLDLSLNKLCIAQSSRKFCERHRNIIFTRWRPHKKRKGNLSPRSEAIMSIICHFPTPPVSHWSLLLMQSLCPQLLVCERSALLFDVWLRILFYLYVVLQQTVLTKLNDL